MGRTYSVSANFGLLWGDDGFINTTVWAHHNDAYDRSGVYTHSAGWYPDDPMLTSEEKAAEDERLRRLNGIDLDRAVLGGAENTNSGIFINAGRHMDEDWDFYAFGGFSSKEVIYSRRTNQFGTMGRFVNLAMNYNWQITARLACATMLGMPAGFGHQLIEKRPMDFL